MSGHKLVFVCLHGAAKSVLAAAAFERLARARGLATRADFAGTEPDPEIAPRVAAALRAEGVELGARRPRRVSGADVTGETAVVTFGCDLGPIAAKAGALESWDDVPAVGEDFDAARAAITARVGALVDRLAAR